MEAAWERIGSLENLTIIDCRPCECQFVQRIPGAVWSDTPSMFHGWHEDVLVYSQEGVVSVDFCEDLLWQVYGSIYHLDGGFDAWKAAGYGIETD